MRKILVIFLALLMLVSTSVAAAGIKSPGGMDGNQQIPFPPVADAGGYYTGETYQNIYFDGSGSTDPNNDIVLYSWDFGDGATGTGKYPIHAYQTEGTFTVTLTVTDSVEYSDTDTTTATVTTTPMTVTVTADPNPTWPGGSGWAWTDITATVEGGVPDYHYLFQFTEGYGQHTGPETSWTMSTAWDEPGFYTVYVTVTDANNVEVTGSVEVEVLACYKEVDTGGPYYGHPDTLVEFSGDFDENPDCMYSATWSFGDGETGNGKDVTHSYSYDGTYDVTLEVIEFCPGGCPGSDTTITTIKTLDIEVNGPDQAPALTEVTYSINVINAFGSQVYYEVTYGDGDSDSFYDGVSTSVTHIYSTDGPRTVQVTATDRIDTTYPYHNAQVIGQHSIQITPAGLYPDAGGPYEAFEDEEIQFDGSGSYTTNGYLIVSYEWDFGDGSTGTGCYATHTYDTYGDYDVTLTITNSNGDSANDGSTSTIMEAYTGLVADAGKPYVGRVGQPVEFDASNSNDAHYYEWDFGDGTTGSGERPSHIYTALGEYTVKLVAKRWFGILNRVIDLTTVTVYPSDETLPTDYAYGGCYYEADQNEPITFDSHSQGNFVEYIWDFGDGNTATGETVTHGYENKGSYLVTLTTKDQQGNKFEDVLHADIEQPLTGLFDFLATFGISAGDSFLEDLYIYTKFYDPITGQTYEKHTLFSNPAEVDVNNDGRNDVRIEKGKPEISTDKSHFSNLFVIVFRDYYTINKLSDTITGDSDFEVSIHFSIADWIKNRISNDVDDDFFKIGFHSGKGEEMPSEFTLKHTLVPYLIRRLMGISPDKTFPEFWSETDITSPSSIDLLAGYFKGNPQNIEESRTLTIHYEPAVKSIMHHRKGKHAGSWIREFGISRTETSVLTFTYSKQDQQGLSNVSFLIDRPVDLSFKLEITPLAAGGGIVEYHSSESLDMILFAESYDQEEQKTTYFYVRNLPKDIVVKWDPSPKGGYIDASATAEEDLDIGLTDNLDEEIATWKLSVSNLPENIHLEWDISVAGQISLLTENTSALALDYFGWNRDKGLTINFHVDTEEDIDVAAAWDLEAGWFKVTRSITLINFRFTVFQKGTTSDEDMTIEINGYISVNPGQEGLVVDFSTFEEGLITISRGDSNIAFSAGVIIKQGDPPSLTVGVETITISAGAGETEILIQWDDTPMFRVDVSAGAGINFDLQNFNMNNTQTGFNMSIGSITSNVGANGQGFAEISWTESQRKLSIGGGGGVGALLQVNDFVTNVPSIGLDMEIGVFEIGGSASANLYLKDNGFDLTAEAHVTIQTLNLESSDIILKLGGFSLGGSGTAYVKSGTGGRLEISGSIGLTVGDVYLEAVGTGGTIEIQGQLDITLGGTFILYQDHFELEGSSQLDLNNNGNNVLFIVNGENIEIMGSFALTAQGTISVYWSETNLEIEGSGGALTVIDFALTYDTLVVSASNIELSASGSVSLTGTSNTFVVDVSGGASVDVAVLDFNMEINQQAFHVLSDDIHVGFDGTFTVEWDTQSTEIWIDAGGTAAFGFDNLAITYGTSVDLSILGSLDFELDGALYLKPGYVEITATGTIDWGVACVFTFNGDSMTIGGLFTLSGGGGTITISGSSTNFIIGISGSPSLNVDCLVFDALIDGEDLSVEAFNIYVGVNGLFTVEWNADTEELWVDAGGAVAFGLENLYLLYGTPTEVDISIVGDLDFNADGSLYLKPGLIEITGSGTINLGTDCVFTFNGDSITVGGTFILSSGSGSITISTDENSFDIYVTGGPSLTISNFYFVGDYWTDVSSSSIILGTNGAFYLELDKSTYKILNIDGAAGIDFSASNLNVEYENDLVLTVGLLDIGLGGFVHVESSVDFNVDFDINGHINLDNFNLNPPDTWNWNLDYVTFDSFNVNGDATGKIKRGVSGSLSVTAGPAGISGSISNLDVYAEDCNYEEFTLEVGSASFSLGANGVFKVYSGSQSGDQIFILAAVDGSASVSNLYYDYKKWVLNLGSMSASGDVEVRAMIYNKWYWVDADAALTVDDLYLDYNSYNEYDIDLDLDYLKFNGGGKAWFDYRLDMGKPEFYIDADVFVDVDNLHLVIGGSSSDTIDVNIPNFDLSGNGRLEATWDDGYLMLDATVDLGWNVTIETDDFGDWQANGGIVGSATMEAYWEDAFETGHVDIHINSVGNIQLLNVIHDDLTLNIGSLQLDPGDVTFEWDRGNYGYFNILNSGVNADMTLCEITYAPSSFEFEIGTIQLKSGNTYIDWQKNTNDGYVHVDNDDGITFVSDLFRVKWGDKEIQLGQFELQSGHFQLDWDTSNPSYHEIQIKNGIPSLRGGCTFISGSQEWTLSVLNFEAEYSKNITFGWYKEGSSITGVYLDTDGKHISDWVTFQTTDGSSGRRINISGPEAQAFYMKKVGSDLEWGGTIHLGNYITYSKRIGGVWKDLEITWDLDLDGIGYIEYDSEFDLIFDISATVLGADIVSTFDLSGYLKIAWDIDFDGQGYVFLDTNWQLIAQISFQISKDAYGYTPKWGLLVEANGFKAQNYQLSWTLWPPSEWDITETGSVQPGSITNIDFAWNGIWYNLWPP